MVKFTATTPDGKPIIGFGLTEGNLVRLRKGEPIKVDLAAMGVPGGGSVMIFYGKDEHAIGRMFLKERFIGPDTKVNVDPRIGDPRWGDG
jgi:hypothetical protein